MKKSAVLLLSFLFISNAAYSEEKPRNELSIWGQGGFSSLYYNMSEGSFRMGGGLGGGLGYTAFFSKHWGFTFGAEVMSYRGKAKLDDFSDSYDYTDSTEGLFVFNYNYKNYEEVQKALYLNIPLMFQYQGNGKHKFFFAIGGKIGIPLSGSFKSSADELKTSGTFDYEGVIYENIGVHDFSTYQMVKSDDLKLKVAGMLSAETGIKWRLGERMSLYTGVFVDYGLNNVNKEKQENHLLEYTGDPATPNNSTMDYYSVLNSYYTNSKGNKETFTDRVVPFSFGLKARLTLGLKAKRDSDKDGVGDDKDLCPNTPTGVRVDKNGCPIDSDGDGVPDYLDQCPKTPAGTRVNKNGCPDEDGDGVADRDDQCPGTPIGTPVDEKGCPLIADSDGDGVPDDIDRCPGTLAGVQVDQYGCPIDTDGDGVPDYLDQCPKTPGKAENRGCPTLKPADAKILKQAIYGVWFDVDKYIIKPGSYPILNQVAKVMRDNPKYLLDIDGHTDSSGGFEHNQILSENRANAVMSYLIDKGVNPARLRARGHGQTMPVATNSTIEGKAQNRRVEFTIRFE